MLARKPDDDILSILISSDVHLGYAERDPIRGDDSFTSFEEVLKIANERQVDMVLLAGDLFHENKPSRKARMRCMQLLRDNCLGGREVKMEAVSDPSTNFHSKCVPPCLWLCRLQWPSWVTRTLGLLQESNCQLRGSKLQCPAPRFLYPRQPR